MKKIALIILTIGILSLYMFYLYSTPIIIKSAKETKNIEDNQKTIIVGKIISQRQFDSNILLNLDINITLNCNKPCPLKDPSNKEIKALAIYNKFYNSFDVKEIKCLNC